MKSSVTLFKLRFLALALLVTLAVALREVPGFVAVVAANLAVQGLRRLPQLV